MSAIFPVFADENLSPEDRINRLQAINNELSDALHRLSDFQKRILTIKKCANIEDTLDQMELLLDEVIEFVYAQLYMRNEDDKMVRLRSMCPDDLEADQSQVEWACENQEIAIIPLDTTGSNIEARSLLILPFNGHMGTVGVLLLWLDIDPSTFTQEQSTLLTMLSRETATVIETHRFRESLERSRTAMEDVVESVPHGIFQIDHENQINLVNSTVEFMLGIRRADVLGRPYGQVLPQVMTSLLDRAIANSINEEQEITHNVRGMEELLGVTVTPMYGQDATDLMGHVIICRDLSMSREIVKLRELDTMKNDFLSLVSHELRTPLTSIMAYSETLLMEGMVDTEEERREYLQIIYDEGARLSRLINDVLDLTKMEAGKMDYVYEEHDIHDIIKTAIGSSSSLADQKNISLERDFGEDVPLVKIDSDRIMQVLMNFLSNAIKFTPEKGTITVRTRATPPEKGKNIPTVTVCVEDTGIGIAPENLNRVFSKFEQIENIDHHAIGTGLGMPICKQIIEDGHGGTIWIESELGKGTQVFFRIPVE